MSSITSEKPKIVNVDTITKPKASNHTQPLAAKTQPQSQQKSQPKKSQQKSHSKTSHNKKDTAKQVTTKKLAAKNVTAKKS